MHSSAGSQRKASILRNPAFLRVGNSSYAEARIVAQKIRAPRLSWATLRTARSLSKFEVSLLIHKIIDKALVYYQDKSNFIYQNFMRIISERSKTKRNVPIWSVSCDKQLKKIKNFKH